MASPDMLLGHSRTLSQPFQAPVEQNEDSAETAEDIVGNVKRCDRPGRGSENGSPHRDDLIAALNPSL